MIYVLYKALTFQVSSKKAGRNYCFLTENTKNQNNLKLFLLEDVELMKDINLIMLKEYDFFTLFNIYLTECKKGKLLLKNGTKMKNGSIQNYICLCKLLQNFCSHSKRKLRVKSLIKCSQQEYIKEKMYWKKFYSALTKYMYGECNHFDNYVGASMKLIRSFFIYLKVEKGIDSRDIPKLFFISREEIPIVVLNAEQLKFLVSNASFELSLCMRLQKAKDVFVFGCAVGLRYSDLKILSPANLEKNYKEYYLKIFSRKTSTYTRVKLPQFAVDILLKYKGKLPTLLPTITLSNFNKSIRELAELAGWTQVIDKKRKKRGVLKSIKKAGSKALFRFCDLLSSHTMRRTAITLYLSLGIPEQLVRRISGHSPGSKEFFRYVKYSEELLDLELNRAHEKFIGKN